MFTKSKPEQGNNVLQSKDSILKDVHEIRQVALFTENKILTITFLLLSI